MLKNLQINTAILAARYLPDRVKTSLYRFPPLAGLIRRQLNLALPGGVSEATIVGGELAGMRMLLDLQNEKDYWLGTYEPELREAIKELVEPGMTAYDIGANIGYITLLLATRVGEEGQVYAFEALPSNLERLKKNISINNLDARVVVNSYAVVDQSKELNFLTGPSGGTGKAEGSAGRLEIDYNSIITVKGTSLDDFVFQQNNPAPQIVKMDIEGGEILAIPGMRRLLAEAHPVVLLEIHGPESVQMAWDTFISSNYEIFHMEPGFPPVNSIESLDWKAYIIAKYAG